MQNRPRTSKEVKFCRLNLQPSFPIVLMQEDKWYSSFSAVTMVHFHNCLQIGYCETGKGYYLIDGNLYPYEQNSISIIPAKILHFCTSQMNTVSRWKWLYLDPIGLLSQLNPAQEQVLMSMLYGRIKVPYILSSADNEQIVRVIECIIREMAEKPPYYMDTVRALTQVLVLFLVRSAGEEYATANKVEQTSLQIITPAIEWISMHYMDPVTIPHLAQLCHISPTHLRRMFRSIMDCTPLDYLQLTRLEAACTMLLHTDQSVLEIGAQAGFATGTSFTRQFKKAFGTTPGQWRIKMSKKAARG